MISCSQDSYSSGKDIGIWISECYYHCVKLATIEFSVCLPAHIKMDKSAMHMCLLAYAHA